MALMEPRNNGTKTLCKRLSPGKLEITIFIVTCAPLLYAEFLENPGDNCIFKESDLTYASTIGFFYVDAVHLV